MGCAGSPIITFILYTFSVGTAVAAVAAAVTVYELRFDCMSVSWQYFQENNVSMERADNNVHFNTPRPDGKR